VRLLLDTHAFLWWVSGDRALGASTRAVIDVPANPVYVSAVTAWEIAIKRSKGTLDAPDGDVATWIAREGFLELDVAVRHATVAGALPPHHRDPFDRMLVAQAQVNDLTLVTSDAQLENYAVEILRADR
jgi:PIN domain nuclease of toxin-antitoxin system